MNIDHYSESTSGQEHLRVAFIAVVQPAPVFYSGKSTFNPVTLLVKFFVVVDWLLAHVPTGNARSDSFTFQEVTNPVRTVTDVG